MKTFIVSLLLCSTVAFAGPNSAAPARVNFVAASLGLSSYLQLIASLGQGVKALTAVNTGSNPVAIAFGPAGSEVQQLIIPVSSSSAPSSFPINANYGQRVSVISLANVNSSGQVNSTGELQLNFIYN